jgi:hypothetical protein
MILLSSCDKNKSINNDKAENNDLLETTRITLEGDSFHIDGTGARADGNNIAITMGGIYEISGTLEDGQILISVFDDAPVHLILNNASINCSDNAAIYVRKAEEAVITLKENTLNSLSDGTDYAYTDNDEPNAVIYSNADLTIDGPGALTITANYNNGITGTDDVIIMDGTITITSQDDGILGKDLIKIDKAQISLITKGDAMKSTNDKDSSKGMILIDGGTIDITSDKDGMEAVNSIIIMDGIIHVDSKDDAINSMKNIEISKGELTLIAKNDAIHADITIQVRGGNIHIEKSYEGMECRNMVISGGDIDINSKDDGINVFANGNAITILDGYIRINSEGDGIDSNGSIFITGGTVLINGPTTKDYGSLDYIGSLEVNGGILVAVGSSGPGQLPSDQSKQNSISFNYANQQNAGTLIHIKSSNEEDLLTFEPAKEFQNVIISLPEFILNETYQLFTGGSSDGSQKDGLFDGGSYTNGVKTADITLKYSVNDINEN